MSWLSSWFGKNKVAAGRSNALSSTRDAFSMPSPMLSPQDAYEPESSASFTYPPQQNGGGASYGYVPTSRRTSLLPLHNNNNNNPYPPLDQTWRRLRTWLGNEYPELGDTLNYAILPQDMQDLEAQFGFALPQAVRESYAQADGQEPESSAACAEGLFFGLHLLPLEEVYDEWRFWRDVDNDPETGGHDRLRTAQQSVPPGWVRREYSNRGWIPLISDKAGNYVGVDLNPDEGGQAGQVIVFGRDFDTKVVLAHGEGAAGWARWLASFADMLESGDGFELQTGDNDSQGSEDDIGYQNYFGTGGEAAEQRGPTGMALAGEYRGWPTLEAFADRGARRWMEAGLVPEYSAQEKGKANEEAQPGMLDLAKATTGENTAAVAIPVYAAPERSESEDLQPAAPAAAAPRAVPTISVTKPPAPRPVLLPTENDILGPSNSDAPSPADVEGGFVIPMAQHSGYAPPPSAAPPKSAASRPVSATPVPEPASESAIFAASPTASAAPAAAPLSDITDLLAESGPALETAALEPAPASDQVSPISAPEGDLLAVDASSEGGSASASDLEDESTAELVAEGAGGEALAADDAKAKTASP